MTTNIYISIINLAESKKSKQKRQGFFCHWNGFTSTPPCWVIFYKSLGTQGEERLIEPEEKLPIIAVLDDFGKKDDYASKVSKAEYSIKDEIR
jgi:hypothetical protein